MMPLSQERSPYVDLAKRMPRNSDEEIRREIRVRA
jgi:hypothetical protein